MLLDLCTKVQTVCENVFTSSRPVATDKMDRFVVVRFSNGIRPYADTHNVAYVQANCFVRDRQGGIENVDVMEDMVDGIVGLFPLDDELVSCSGNPIVLDTKSDGMGFHSTIIQFIAVIKI